MITIIDCGLGNLGSVANMIRKLGAQSRISSRPDDIAAAKALILPGVGHFDTGMKNLRRLGLEEVLASQVLQKRTPILGICLGMQLFARRSEEGRAQGLGWLAAEVRRFSFTPSQQLAVPHMGWNEIEGASTVLFGGRSSEGTRFYFMHSYYMVTDNSSDVVAWASYGQRFAAAVQHDNIYGVQFHPEKSHRFGMALLRSFIELANRAA